MVKWRGGRNREGRTVALFTNGLTMNAAGNMKASLGCVSGVICMRAQCCPKKPAAAMLRRV